MPYLAATFVVDHFARSFFMNYAEFRIGMILDRASERQVSESSGDQVAALRNMLHL